MVREQRAEQEPGFPTIFPKKEWTYGNSGKEALIDYIASMLSRW